MPSFQHLLLTTSLILVTTSPALCQTSTVPTRDPQAVAVVQKALSAMGTIPTDSTATGSVQIVEGSTSEAGTIQIETLGTSSTNETISLPSGQRIIIYSYGEAKETAMGNAVTSPLETVVTDQCADFPLPLLSSLYASADVAIHYIGAETLNGESVQHVEMWNTFATKPRILQKLAAYSMRDVWFDSSTGLPVKIAYSRRTGGGAMPAIPVEVYFSSWKPVNGGLYPFQINKSYDGTPWQTITINSVAFNTGLTADQFQTE